MTPESVPYALAVVIEEDAVSQSLDIWLIVLIFGCPPSVIFRVLHVKQYDWYHWDTWVWDSQNAYYVGGSICLKLSNHPACADRPLLTLSNMQTVLAYTSLNRSPQARLVLGDSTRLTQDEIIEVREVGCILNLDVVHAS